VRLGEQHPDLVAITAAMLQPTGLAAFADRFPDRCFDVGIAEQHAVTSAAGLAMAGMKPVVAVYATFLNRAVDQVLMDVALHSLPVVFVLDRAGVTGDDGPSHNGVWDMSLLQVVPGLRIAAPRDATALRRTLGEAVAHDEGPSVVRFPKGAVGEDIPAVESIDGVDVLHRSAPVSPCLAGPDGGEGSAPGVLLVSYGAMAPTAREAAELLAGQGIGVTVVDPRWIRPVSAALVELAAAYEMVVTLEDNVRVGGAGAALAQALADAGRTVPVRTFGVPPRFLTHGKRAEVLAACGLSAQDIARSVTEQMAAHTGWSAQNTSAKEEVA